VPRIEWVKLELEAEAVDLVEHEARHHLLRPRLPQHRVGLHAHAFHHVHHLLIVIVRAGWGTGTQRA